MDIVKKVLPKEEIAPVAQLDRASDFGSEGLGFESLRAHLKYNHLYILQSLEQATFALCQEHF